MQCSAWKVDSATGSELDTLGFGYDQTRAKEVETDSIISFKKELEQMHTDSKQLSLVKKSYFDRTEWKSQGESDLTVVHSEPFTRVMPPARTLLSEVKATVISVDEDQVRLSCEFKNGQTMTIRLPSGLVPKASLRYGAPVTVSKSTEGGYLHFKITPRQVVPISDLTKEIEELEQWMNT